MSAQTCAASASPKGFLAEKVLIVQEANRWIKGKLRLYLLFLSLPYRILLWQQFPCFTFSCDL